MLNLLFDADGTLYDFKATEKIALAMVFARYGIPYTEENIGIYHIGNRRLWDDYEKGLIKQEEIPGGRFGLLFSELGIDADMDEAGDYYSSQLGSHGIMIDGAVEFLEKIKSAGIFQNYIITNGISDIQWARFRGTGTVGFFKKIFISGEMGVQKPQKVFFDKVLAEAGIEAKDSIVIGDSEKSDIQGAVNSGIRSIYLNFDGEKSQLADYSVSSYSQLYSLLNDIV